MGRGRQAGVLHRPTLTGVLGVLVLERGAHDVEGLVQRRTTIVEVEVEQFELGIDVARAHTEDGAPVRHVVEREESFRRHQRMPIRQHVHVAEQARLRGDAGEVSEGRERVPPRRAHGFVVRPGNRDVVAHRDIEEAALVADLRDGGELVDACAGLPVLGVPGALRLDGQLDPVHELPGWDDSGHGSPSHRPDQN